MDNDQAVWTQMVAEHGLKESDIDRLVSPWHTDADLGRPIEVVTDMSKSRAMGFTASRSGATEPHSPSEYSGLIQLGSITTTCPLS